jgi:hypothetical protein
MPTLFVDTNLFLQCREPAELPWEQVAGGQDVLALIPRAVQQEIDRLKQAGSSRRAKRARRASSLFREIVDAPGLRRVVRDAGPRVELAFPPLPDPNRDRLPQLDPTHADDRIVEEALAYRTTHPGEDVRLLTDDTNLMLTARQCDLRYVAVPESWLLPPEPDERDKALAEVRRRLDALEHNHPAIGVAVVGASGQPTDHVRIRVDAHPDLSESDINRLVEEVRIKHPMVVIFEGHGKPSPTRLATFGLGRYEPPTQAEIKRYQEVEYPSWLQAVKRTFESLPRQLEAPTRTVELAFVLTNDGSCPAENVVVEFSALGGLLIAPPKKDDDEAGAASESPAKPLSLPPPPRAPVGRHVDLVGDLSKTMELITRPTFDERVLADRFLPPLRQPERDPLAFYWKGTRPARHVSDWTLTCEEFRHKADPERFGLVLFLPRKVTTPKAAVSCRVTARNVPEPRSVTVPVIVTYTTRDTVAAAQHLVA